MSGVALPRPLGQRIRLYGRVQGVGMRPTLWRLARDFELRGSVRNDAAGVVLELWGPLADVDALLARLPEELPPLAQLDDIACEPLYRPGPEDFRIEASTAAQALTAVLPDAATCPECLAEITNPGERRYRYPFASCTHCGPRLSIQSGLPWDRARTSMAVFELCADCEAEYNDPRDRRFHAQPIACAACGPRACLVDSQGKALPSEQQQTDAVAAAAALITAGGIVAIKGLGGFHLACDAANEQAVARLRRLKRRDGKPFALMARDVETIAGFCEMNNEAAARLQSPAAPIVLLPCRDRTPALASGIAPGLNMLGFMLPTTPLHHLLLMDCNCTLVMTSGNLSGEPPCIDNDEAIHRLGPVVDALLLHNRDIINRLDDSVWQIAGQQARPLRLARGYAPEQLPLPPGLSVPQPLLALGGELKASFCLLRENGFILGQHIGDLSSLANLEDYQRAQARYRALFQCSPAALVVDRHPDYRSTRLGEQWASGEDLPLIRVQHHHAHIAACMAEHGLPVEHPAVLGVTLDGLGYGDDGELWGGEILLADYRDYRRLAHLQPMPLIGGEQAMREPWRNAYAHIHSTLGWEPYRSRYADLGLTRFLQSQPLGTIQRMLERQLNCPVSSSAGRWFDAVAAALNLCRENQDYEGQAAMQLQALAEQVPLPAASEAYHLRITESGAGLELQAETLWQSLLRDLADGVDRAVIAARFHEGLAQSLVELLSVLMQRHGQRSVVLTGGVFQNRLLLSRVETLLRARSVSVFSHRRVPANDGGLALGQAMVAAVRLQDRQMGKKVKKGVS